jgi:hypothetical protein
MLPGIGGCSDLILSKVNCPETQETGTDNGYAKSHFQTIAVRLARH